MTACDVVIMNADPGKDVDVVMSEVDTGSSGDIQFEEFAAWYLERYRARMDAVAAASNGRAAAFYFALPPCVLRVVFCSGENTIGYHVEVIITIRAPIHQA
eukprot:SAG11_NODE_2527_length_3253_cov_1.733756_3_plen_101_part_00